MLNPFHKQTTKTYAVILRPFFSTSHTIEVRFWGQKCIKVIRKVFHEEVSLEQERDRAPCCSKFQNYVSIDSAHIQLLIGLKFIPTQSVSDRYVPFWYQIGICRSITGEYQYPFTAIDAPVYEGYWWRQLSPKLSELLLLYFFRVALCEKLRIFVYTWTSLPVALSLLIVTSQFLSNSKNEFPFRYFLACFILETHLHKNKVV